MNYINSLFVPINAISPSSYGPYDLVVDGAPANAIFSYYYATWKNSTVTWEYTTGNKAIVMA